MDFVFGKYDPKDTKYKHIEEESKDMSFQGYPQQDNIIKDLSGGNSNTGSLNEKPKQQKKSARKTAKAEELDQTKEGLEAAEGTKKKKKKRIIRKKKGKKGEKKGDDQQNYEEMDQDEIEQQINEELDAAEMAKNLPDEELEDAQPNKKKSARKEKKSARKEKASARKEKASARKENSKSARKAKESARNNPEGGDKASARLEKVETDRKGSKSARKGKKSARKTKKSGRKNSGDRVQPADHLDDQDDQKQEGDLSADEEAQDI